MTEIERLTKERDELRAEVVALKAVLKWYVENDDTREEAWEVANAAALRNKRCAMRLLGLLEAT